MFILFTVFIVCLVVSSHHHHHPRFIGFIRDLFSAAEKNVEKCVRFWAAIFAITAVFLLFVSADTLLAVCLVVFTFSGKFHQPYFH